MACLELLPVSWTPGKGFGEAGGVSWSVRVSIASSRSRRCGRLGIGARAGGKRSPCAREPVEEVGRATLHDRLEAFRDHRKMKAVAPEIERLKRDVQKLKTERDISKKVAA